MYTWECKFEEIFLVKIAFYFRISFIVLKISAKQIIESIMTLLKLLLLYSSQHFTEDPYAAASYLGSPILLAIARIMLLFS